MTEELSELQVKHKHISNDHANVLKTAQETGASEAKLKEEVKRLNESITEREAKLVCD